MKLKIKNSEHKELAIKYLYKDWLDYKKVTEASFDDGYKLKEGFISYLSREANNLELIPIKDNH
mgnify:CR=1 FL=1